MLLPIPSLWPIIFLEGAADTLRWAHSVAAAANCFFLFHYFALRGFQCPQLVFFHYLSLLIIASFGFMRFLGGTLDGPIVLADAAANCFALAQYISGRHYQRIRMGLLHWRMLLPIAMFWPNIFLGGTADALRWAHCISRCCC